MRSQKPANSGNLYNLILENVSEIIYFVETNGDPTRGSVNFASPSVEEIAGYTGDEFTKNPALKEITYAGRRILDASASKNVLKAQTSVPPTKCIRTKSPRSRYGRM